jgi:hypothetical protein
MRQKWESIGLRLDSSRRKPRYGVVAFFTCDLRLILFKANERKILERDAMMLDLSREYGFRGLGSIMATPCSTQDADAFSKRLEDELSKYVGELETEKVFILFHFLYFHFME